jgi:hypothetical protein
MSYAIITKRTFRTKNVTRTEKLKNKLGRDLLPEEIIYDTNTTTEYLCVIRPNSSDYEIRTTKIKKDAIFYTERELPMVQYRLKNKTYYIIDVKTKEEILRIPAAINIALEELETVGDVKINA